MNKPTTDIPLIEYFEYIEKLQEEAERRFVAKIKVRDNSFNCVVLKNANTYLVGVEYTIKYSMNGKERILHHLDEMNESKDQILTDLIKVLSEDIAKNILVTISKEITACSRI